MRIATANKRWFITSTMLALFLLMGLAAGLVRAHGQGAHDGDRHGQGMMGGQTMMRLQQQAGPDVEELMTAHEDMSER